MSYKTEVLVEGEWSTNGCRYATEKEATEAGKELLSRHLADLNAITDSRAALSNDEVNYRFDFEQYKSIRID